MNLRTKFLASYWIWLLTAAPSLADEPRFPNVGRTFQSVAEIQEHHDRALLTDLTGYLDAHPQADDRELAFMVLFNTVIEHDWFSEYETAAQNYLDEQSDGAVGPLAQIVLTMARAQTGRFPEALESYRDLLADLEGPEQEEFAVNFADALANTAAAAGAYDAARQVYHGLLRPFGDSPTLRQKVRDDLARLDRVGQPAPALVVNDINGETFRLSDLKGQYVLVDFWATWCAPCLAELPNLQALYNRYHDRGFEIVGISLDEAPADVADFVRERRLPWRQIHNATGGFDAVEAFGVNAIPATFLIDPKGTIIRLELRGAALEQALDELIR